ncbi:MAG: amino acid decarboxylase [Ignavibacteria bacterium RBG_16_34_14]|nr:MAG: amino acid decarboxylase [Ignavibacteria bacterium RBG_16_34_14]
MPADEFRKFGYQLIDWVTDYLTNVEKYPVLPNIKPGDIRKKLPSSPPEKSEGMEKIFSDVDKIILPGVTHWNHPLFMAYFNSSSSGPGILAELLSAAFNTNGMLWRTNPSSAELEQHTLQWLREMLGMPEGFWGIIYDTASTASMHAIAAARQNAGIKVREKGLAGRSDVHKLRLYASEQAHSSIDKSAITLGIGLDALRKIPTDNEFRMLPGELDKAIVEDKKNGWLPFCVVATVGTTSTTSIDPVDKIADICERENLWLHVDGAHGGSAAIIPEMRWILKGTERADSFLVNPHKWLFHPVDITAFYTRKPDVLKRAFSLVADYLKTPEVKEVDNYMDYGIQLGRRFRALKLWFVIRYFGVEGLRDRLRYHLYLGKEFTKWVDEYPDFERMAPVPMSTICFRLHPENINDENELEKLNLRLVNELDATGDILVSHTRLNGKYVLRVNMSGLRMELKHIEKAWEIIKTKAEEILRRLKIKL